MRKIIRVKKNKKLYLLLKIYIKKIFINKFNISDKNIKNSLRNKLFLQKKIDNTRNRKKI